MRRLEYEAYSKLAMRTMIEVLEDARTMTDDLMHRTPSHAPASFSQLRPSKTVNGVGKPHLNGSSHHTDIPIPPPTEQSSSPSTPASQPSSLIKLALHHRLGSVPVGQPSIVIAVSSPHRKEAFVACEWILEETKKRVQVWKKEVYDTRRRHDGGKGVGDVGGEGGGDGEEEEEESEWKANAIHVNAGVRS